VSGSSENASNCSAAYPQPSSATCPTTSQTRSADAVSDSEAVTTA
jgi:hypothetical protein